MCDGSICKVMVRDSCGLFYSTPLYSWPLVLSRAMFGCKGSVFCVVNTSCKQYPIWSETCCNECAAHVSDQTAIKGIVIMSSLISANNKASISTVFDWVKLVCCEGTYLTFPPCYITVYRRFTGGSGLIIKTSLDKTADVLRTLLKGRERGCQTSL